MVNLPAPNLRCSQCSAPIPTSADLPSALSPEELAALPPTLTSRARILCSSCAEAETQASGLDAPQKSTSRYFRVVLTVQEQIDLTLDPTSPDTEWETVGNFILRGPADSVAEFVASQGDEFGKRMQVILDFADR